MNTTDAADVIWNAWKNQGEYPETLSAWLDYDKALDVQSELLKRRINDGEILRGWKIGLTSERVRTKLGTDDQPFGHVMQVLGHNDSIVYDDIGAGASIEPELVVTLGKALSGPNVTVEQAREACSHVAAGMEINQNRIPYMEDFPLLVADNLTQWAIARGTPVEITDSFSSDQLRVIMKCNDEIKTDVIGTEEVIDDHFRSVAALANVLATRGHALQAGQHVITGSFCRHPMAAGETWTADFSGLGEVSIIVR